MKIERDLDRIADKINEKSVRRARVDKRQAADPRFIIFYLNMQNIKRLSSDTYDKYKFFSFNKFLKGITSFCFA